MPLDLSAIQGAELRLPTEPSELRIALLDADEQLIAIAGGGKTPGQLQPQIVFRD